jgi:hypothetical protein
MNIRDHTTPADARPLDSGNGGLARGDDCRYPELPA